MDLELHDKRALVTGSSAGIGSAIAKRLAEEGAAVVVRGRDQRKAEAVAQEIRSGTKQAIASIGGRPRLTEDQAGELQRRMIEVSGHDRVARWILEERTP